MTAAGASALWLAAMSPIPQQPPCSGTCIASSTQSQNQNFATGSCGTYGVGFMITNPTNATCSTATGTCTGQCSFTVTSHVNIPLGCDQVLTFSGTECGTAIPTQQNLTWCPGGWCQVRQVTIPVTCGQDCDIDYNLAGSGTSATVSVKLSCSDACP
jgi:hypothetical protein